MTKIRVRKGIRSYQGMSDYIYLALTLFFLVACGLAVFLPLLYVVSASFSSPSAIGNGRVYLLPVDLSLAGYTAVVTSSRVWLGFRNSVIYTVLGTTLNIAMTMLAAYPLSRKDLKGRGVIMKLFTFTMLFGGGMIPNYLLMSNLNLLNTVWVMIIPGAISVYNMIVARTYIVNSIPSELYESASLDGCTDDRYLWSIVLPLSKPIIAVLVLWYAVGHWNAYFNAMIYLKDKSRSPLQIVLREFLIVEDMSEANIADNIEAYGLDVICEKPLGASMEACVRIYNKIKNAGLKLAVTMSHRFEHEKQTVEQLVKSGMYGKLNYVVSRLNIVRGLYANINTVERYVTDCLVHNLDTMRGMAGADVKTVYADYWPHTDNGEYIGWSGLTMLEMTNGVRASLEESFANGSTMDGWSNEYLRAECTDGTIIASHKKVTLRSDCGLPYPQEAEMPLAKGDYWDHALIIRSFIRWLDGGDAPVTCIDDNMQCAALMFAAIESAKTEKKIDVQEYLRKYL